MIESEIKKIIEEYEKCRLDPLFFMEKHIKIYDPFYRRDYINFTPSINQRKFLNNYITNSMISLSDNRQTGKTTIGMLCLLHYITFNPNSEIYIKSHHNVASMNLLDTICRTNVQIPPIYKKSTVRKNRDSITFENNSKIKILSTHESCYGMGKSKIDILYFDEVSSENIMKYYEIIKNVPIKKAIFTNSKE